MIKAILFDIDGVLLGVRRADAKTYEHILTDVGYDMPDEQLVQSVTHLPLWEGLKRLLDTDDAEEINRVRNGFLKLHKNDYQIEPVGDVFGIVKQVAEKYRVAVVTSRFKTDALKVLNELGVVSFFDHLVCYEDTVEHKPHPAPLQLSVEQLGIKPHEAVYVGDMDYDVQSAQAAGLKSIHISAINDQPATITINNLGQLPGAIGRL
jgi:HAD superfamily hydrolase (TIGR01509 family)